MQEIKKITILGAGAMGAYFASRFFDAPEFSTTLIARDERYDRLRSQGLVVNGKDYSIPVIHPDDTSLDADITVVALKHQQLADACRDRTEVVGDQTTIMSCMSWLD